jgi:hypothetical protein
MDDRRQPWVAEKLESLVSSQKLSCSIHVHVSSRHEAPPFRAARLALRAKESTRIDVSVRCAL